MSKDFKLPDKKVKEMNSNGDPKSNVVLERQNSVQKEAGVGEDLGVPRSNHKNIAAIFLIISELSISVYYFSDIIVSSPA